MMMMTMSTTKKTNPFRGHSKSSDHHGRCHRRPSIGGRSNVISYIRRVYYVPVRLKFPLLLTQVSIYH